jgi:hypothetical protein
VSARARQRGLFFRVADETVIVLVLKGCAVSERD